MKVADKWQDITLVNSKCSQARSQGEISLYKAVIKNLKENRCIMHNMIYSYYYDQQILCALCFIMNVNKLQKSVDQPTMKKYEFIYSLETILNHPIILAIEKNELLKYPVELIELIVTSYKQVYQKKSDFKLKKTLIQSFVSRIKSRVDSLCDDILGAFDRMQENLTKQSALKEQMINLSAIYEEQLVQMFGQNFVQNKKEELQSILNDYSSNNQSPFTKISQNLSEMMSCLMQELVVDVEALQKIYRTVTDELFWKPNRVLVSRNSYFQQKFQRANMIINNEYIQLQKQYTLKMQEDKFTLLMNEQEIGKLHMRIDSFYTLPNYKLLGVNYNKIFVINYFDQLTIQEEFLINGCTDLINFPNHLVAVSNQQLIKIELATQKYTILGYNYSDLRYCRNKPNLFACQNEHGITTYWNVWSDKPQVIWF